MRLLELELKNFGKFHNKKLELESGINLVYGENESGKSTVHTFIRGMLFGIERGRGRASVNDTFSKYEPWENCNYYSGNMRFECGEKVFCLQRNFDKVSKRAWLVCETDGEELSVENGDLEMLLDGLTGTSYENTLCVGQLRAPVGQSLADELKNYATSYYTSGDSDVDLTAAQEVLATKKKEVDRDIKRLLQERQKKREAVEQEASYIWREIHQLDSELDEISKELERRIKEEKQEKKSAKEKAEWGKRRMIDEIRPEKWRIHPLEIAAILLVILGSFLLIPKPINSFVTVIIALLGTIYIWNRMKLGKKKDAEQPELPEDITEELVSTDKLIWKQEHLNAEREEKQIEYDNLQEQLQEMDDMGEEYLELDRRREALLLAASRLTEASGDMQIRLTDTLNCEASKIIEKITGGRYKMLRVDDTLHMTVMDGAKVVPMERLSQGTLEQIYFSLRMAVANMMYREEYPIILDDTFAFYDDIRLEHTLRWLSECGKQVLIFSCQKREEEVLRRAGIAYTEIRL